ncbi:hypothetical protein BJ165DRAFT_1533166 [Panaeolus papilionaceus]|nr:hypothetical protein BJ165DRAFT_1533166 [Panaeolus papilionaceus]
MVSPVLSTGRARLCEVIDRGVAPAPIDGHLEPSPITTVILLLGPTGAGKSSFIEALAGPNHTLKKISSSGLAGYTQQVTTYRVTGILLKTDGRSLYILDTPGFADPKIAELDIVSSIRQWWIDNLLVMITADSGPLNQRRVLNTFKALTGKDGASMVTIVTTMWDSGGEQASKRAERNFEQLKDEVWKAFIEAGSQITKFHNTHESALRVLDQAARKQSNITDLERFSIPLNTHVYATNLRDDLISRLNTLHIQKDLLDAELDDPSIESDISLKTTLEAEVKEASSSQNFRHNSMILVLC